MTTWLVIVLMVNIGFHYMLDQHVLVNSLSIIDTKGRSIRNDAAFGHDGHQSEWDVDDWWRQTINDDIRKQFAIKRSRYMEAPSSFEYRIASLPKSSSLSLPPSSSSSSIVETGRSYSNGWPIVKMPSLYYPTLSSSSAYSSIIIPAVSNHRDLDASESLAMKTSVEDSNNSLLPIGWRNHKNGSIRNDPVDDGYDDDESFFFIPKSTLPSIKGLFNTYFIKHVRSVRVNNDNFIRLKRILRSKFQDYGLKSGLQKVDPRIKNIANAGHNLVGIYPGIYRNDTDRDSILVIGAHYDTVPNSVGIEDNASGSVAIMELARVLHEHRCALNMTIMFVLFDMEEDGLYGSKTFVRDYLFPVEIGMRHVPVKGAIVIDMLLEYDTDPGSQDTSHLGPLVPSWRESVRANHNRADFAAVWARRGTGDTALYKTLKHNWLNQSKYKLLLLDPPLPRLGRQLTIGLNNKKLTPYKTFLRSDHSSFWYPHSIKDQSIPAILLTDLGPWRRRVAHRYHSSADNDKLLTKQNLLFLKNSIDSLLKTIIDMGDGRCHPPPANSVEAATA
ncbi:hypothetical protein BLOT_002489 [Blomia tropicalis]|nr:hypothetical protein BLOT_002489 [Blomia tropicalis]